MDCTPAMWDMFLTNKCVMYGCCHGNLRLRMDGVPGILWLYPSNAVSAVCKSFQYTCMISTALAPSVPARMSATGLKQNGTGNPELGHIWSGIGSEGMCHHSTGCDPAAAIAASYTPRPPLIVAISGGGGNGSMALTLAITASRDHSRVHLPSMSLMFCTSDGTCAWLVPVPWEYAPSWSCSRYWSESLKCAGRAAAPIELSVPDIRFSPVNCSTTLARACRVFVSTINGAVTKYTAPPSRYKPPISTWRISGPSVEAMSPNLFPRSPNSDLMLPIATLTCSPVGSMV